MDMLCSEKCRAFNRAATYFITDFIDIMQQGLALCMLQERLFKEEWIEDPGLYIEAIMADVERISTEKGQVAVWIAYALHDLLK